MYEVAFASPGALLAMFVQLPQAAEPAFCWYWYLVMLESLGSVHASATCLSPAVAIRPAGFAGLLAVAGAVRLSETFWPLVHFGRLEPELHLSAEPLIVAAEMAKEELPAFSVSAPRAVLAFAAETPVNARLSQPVPTLTPPLLER